MVRRTCYAIGAPSVQRLGNQLNDDKNACRSWCHHISYNIIGEGGMASQWPISWGSWHRGFNLPISYSPTWVSAILAGVASKLWLQLLWQPGCRSWTQKRSTMNLSNHVKDPDTDSLAAYLLQSIGVCWGCDVWCVYLVRWPFKELHTHNRSLLTKAMVQYWTSTLLQIKLGIHLKTDLMKKSHRTENLNTDCCRIKWTLNLVLRVPPHLIHCVLRVRCRPAMWPSSQDFPHDLLIANQKYI